MQMINISLKSSGCHHWHLRMELQHNPDWFDILILAYLHPTHWSWWKSEASFCAPRGPMRAIYEDRIWQTQFPSCCTQNMELFTAASPFANHQPTTVPVWAQNSSLQMRLHMTFTSENYWGVNLFTYLLTYLPGLSWKVVVKQVYCSNMACV